MYQNYIFFLFCELSRGKNRQLMQEPYDVQFKAYLELYNEYTQSPESDQNKSEYQCILDFWINKGTKEYIKLNQF